MSDVQAFTIDKVGWHTQTPGNTESVDHIHRRFRAVAVFLQENGLTTRTLLGPHGAVTDEFEIHTSDLTPEGLALAKACYDTWLRRIDKGKSPEDVSLLRRTLEKLRSGE